MGLVVVVALGAEVTGAAGLDGREDASIQLDARNVVNMATALSLRRTFEGCWFVVVVGWVGDQVDEE